LLILLFIPSLSFAQADTACTYDMYNCYLHSLRAFLHGTSGLEQMHEKHMNKKTTTLYIPKRFYTSGFPDEIDGFKVQYLDIAENIDMLYDELQSKKGTLVYMSELNVTAEKCDLWLMPVKIVKNKNGGTLEPQYTEKGCHLYFRVCKENGRLGYDMTFCPTGKD
jgi:hypothetical protein